MTARMYHNTLQFERLCRKHTRNFIWLGNKNFYLNPDIIVSAG